MPLAVPLILIRLPEIYLLAQHALFAGLTSFYLLTANGAKFKQPTGENDP
jgi:hypothetical protein